MARPPRLLIPGGFYHVTSRGNDRQPIFADDVDRQRFIATLTEVAEASGWCVLSYCLMGNHFHLLVRTAEPNLDAGMQRLNGSYAKWFNRRHERVGHLFQGRYGAKVVRSDRHLRATIRYIVRNPVRGGLCASPRQWRWSSHRAALAEVAAPAFLDVKRLLSYYGADPHVARRSYSEDMERVDARDIDPHTCLRQEDLAALLDAGESEEGIALARSEGFSLREIARHLGVNASTVSRRLQHRGQPRATIGA